MIDSQWNLSNPPPAGHKDVGAFAWALYEASQNEKDRLHLPDIWKNNYMLWRGNHWGSKKKRNTLSLNLFFSNVERTVANITSKKPVAEAIDLDGKNDGADKTLTAQLRAWWNDTHQQQKFKRTIQANEVNGITIEKYYWDAVNKAPGVLVMSPYAYCPAPGYWEDIQTDCPYIAHAFADDVNALEAMYKVKRDKDNNPVIKPSNVYSLLGEDREEVRPTVSGTSYRTMNHVSNRTVIEHPTDMDSKYRQPRALAVEVWLRDVSKRPVVIAEAEVDDDGAEIKAAVMGEEQIYPDGIRVITVTNNGELVLDDKPNPNINWELEVDLTEKCHLFGKMPFYIENSYEDIESNWGFSAADQTLDLVYTIDQILSKSIDYIQKSMTGILILPPKTGITRKQLVNKAGLVLQCATLEGANGIRLLSYPNLNSSYFQILDLLMTLYDRVYSIQDADRGNNPPGVRAASAIVALQERNQVLIQHKINAADAIISQRGAAAISLWQNHGHDAKVIEVQDKQEQFRGINYLGREFEFIVEAGSTIHKTELQLQEQAIALYDKNAIDRKALLEVLNFPKNAEILERMAEKDLEAAMNILVQAGLPEQDAQELIAYLSEQQTGTGEEGQVVTTPQAGVPTAFQGEAI